MMMLLTTVTCLPQYSSQYDEEYYNYDEYQDYYDESANYEDMVNDFYDLHSIDVEEMLSPFSLF